MTSAQDATPLSWIFGGHLYSAQWPLFPAAVPEHIDIPDFPGVFLCSLQGGRGLIGSQPADRSGSAQLVTSPSCRWESGGEHADTFLRGPPELQGFLCGGRRMLRLSVSVKTASIFNAAGLNLQLPLAQRHSLLLAQTMRKKCKSVRALFVLWPLELAAACAGLFPEPDRT